MSAVRRLEGREAGAMNLAVVGDPCHVGTAFFFAFVITPIVLCGIAVVAVFFGVDDVIAANFFATNAVAAVPLLKVAIIAVLTGVDDCIAAPHAFIESIIPF